MISIAASFNNVAMLDRTASNDEPLADQAYRLIEERIVTLDLNPGEKLTEAMLAERTRLGRTPVREAVQRLAREGLLEVLPRKGLQVTILAPSMQLLVLEVRRELERLLARLAAERATLAERELFRSVANGMDAAATAADDIAFMRYDRDLNLLLSIAAHNDYAAGTMRLINGHSRRFWYQHHKVRGDLARCAHLHAEQARALADGAASQAIAATDRLLDYTVAFTQTIARGVS